MAILRPILNKLKLSLDKWGVFLFKRNGVSYWEDRAKKYGVLAVLDRRHQREEIDKVTLYQVGQIFPFLRKFMNGNEQTLLDFGCGTGRFVPFFRDLVDGRIIGVDPIRSLIEHGPKLNAVEYRVMENPSRIPVASDFADIVWICLVFGGLRESMIRKQLREIVRIAKPGCLLCLSENTSDKVSGANWAFRSKSYYELLFPGTTLEHVNDYYDFDERVSVFIGRINK